ncbi:hypothetical protein TNCV_1232981 [Trichonephila clavipes]|nr:hypothetical protein TNCV_1232981 [Trichonephila clavipes]
MTPELASPLTSTPHQQEDIRVSTNLICITPLHGGSSAVLGSNSRHAGHEFVTLTTRLPRLTKEWKIAEPFEQNRRASDLQGSKRKVKANERKRKFWQLQIDDDTHQA